MMGIADIVDIEDEDIVIANCYTQFNAGHDGARYADPKSIQIAMEACFVEAKARNLPLYAPKIGCDLGGVDWETEVKPIFESLNTEYQHVVDFTVMVWP
jgi:hypothetical protein